MLTLFAAAPLLFLMPIASPTLLLGSIQNSGHTLLFALLSFTWLEWRWRNPGRSRLASRWRDILIVTASLFCVGVAVELVQSVLARTASLGDITLNSVGLIAGVAFHWARSGGTMNPTKPGRHEVRRTGMALVGLLALIFGLFRPLQYIWIELYVDHPSIVSDFESGLDHLTTEAVDGAEIKYVDAPVDWLLNPSRVMQVDFPTTTYPGFALIEPRGDWTLGEQFTIDVFNPEGETTALSLRINDADHNNTFDDRFNTVLCIEPGSNRLVIPMADVQHPQGDGPGQRELDLSNITGLVAFVLNNEQNRRLYFDNLRLVRAPGVRIDAASPQSPPPPLAMNPMR